MKPIISVEGLGKRYTIRHEGRERYRSLREEIFQLPKRLWQRSQESKEDFWALKDVTFDIMPGDRVGIIGRNGAGKSTLLKLLSRITEPTTGRITLRGRVASLLEVGTGFHPELTGRENIYLNGAILGMSRAEVRRKFDEIVDFAGVEQFLDTPVKRYSSGMYVRLAFAVAAHLEPEILIVDEVLAVGDAEFQKKCLGKMEEVGKEGRTVLFVSHNMAAILQLCLKSILFDKGILHKYDSSKNIINIYNKNKSVALKSYVNGDDFKYSRLINCKEKIIEEIKLYDSSRNLKNTYQMNSELNIEIYLKEKCLSNNIDIGIDIYNSYGIKVISYTTWKTGIGVKKNQRKLLLTLKKIYLTPGTYHVHICAAQKNPGVYIDRIEPAISFIIEGIDVFNSGFFYNQEDGLIFNPCMLRYIND